MKNMKKILLVLLAAVALVGATVMGTLAWLTDRETVTNTMTVGKVDITVDEAKVDLEGNLIPGSDRVQSNEYRLIPGKTYIKDPTMTVAADSEDTYVRMLLTINCKSQLDTIFDPGVELTSIFNGYDASNWIYKKETVNTTANTITYEFRYKDIVAPEGNAIVLDALFDSFTVPGELDGIELESIKDLKIIVEGHAIQSEGFVDDDAAWAAFDRQINF